MASLVILGTHYHSPDADEHELEVCSLCLHTQNNHYFLTVSGLKLQINGTAYHQLRNLYVIRLNSQASFYYSRAPPG